MNIKDWLMFGRMHSASLIQGVYVLGYLLAGNDLISWGTIHWAIVGTLFHYFGFSMNNVFDLRHDLKDPYKTSHPLVAGKINPRDGWAVVLIFLVLYVVSGSIMCIGVTWAYGLFIFSLINGIIYNAYSKDCLLAPIPISLCFGLPVLVSYLASGGQPTLLISLVTLYITGQIIFQISVEGYMKELETDQLNLMKVLGVEIKDGQLIESWLATGFAILIKVPFLLLIVPIMLISSTGVIFGSFALVLVLLAMVWTFALVSTREWDHSKTVKTCAVTEIATFYALLAAVAGVINVTVSLFLMGYLLAWYVFWNRYYWPGQTITPQV
ncbi:UbiA prenyltransferase family protein [Candidatus Pacearchaeota archaeon]|nr:UbiA prenyltransferase family protein [Candidatus Pacearchaeota archaeon]